METPEVRTNSRPIWLYVLNFAALTILALAVVIAANWGTSVVFDRFSAFHSHLRADWTSNHVFTLSPSSVKLLAQVDAKNQPWELDYFDPAVMSNDPVTSTQVRDLLDEYAGASHMIKVRTFGSGDRDELEQRIRDRFSGEIKPYTTALDHADTTLKDLKTFFTQEGAALGTLSATDKLDPDERDLWQRMQGGYTKEVPAELEKARQEISNQLNSTLPEYTQTVSTAKEAMDMAVQILDTNFVSFPQNPEFKTLSKPGQAYFNDGMKRFKDQLDKVQAVAAELGGLKPLAMDAIRSALVPKSVVIFAPASVKIVVPQDMLKAQTSQDPNAAPSASFAGEQALSSTILTIVRPDKPQIVFVSVTPSNLVSGSYSDFAQSLTAANFQVLEWSPSQDAANANPPAIGKGVVWVVFPPPPFDPQQMQMGNMPNPAPLVAALRHHMDLGGNALFLAEAGGASPAIPGMASTGYPFNEITSRFGINVKTQFSIVKLEPGRNDDTQTIPVVEAHTFAKSDITDPVQGFPTIFLFDRTASQAGMGMLVGGPTPLDIAKPLPDGTTVQPLLTVNASDYWATPNPTTTTTRADGDYDGPLIVMASASQKKGADEQRIVVIGNAQVATNNLMEMAVMTQDGPMAQFPGNGELAANSVMWLAGYENMIAVSAKAEASLRIKDMSGPKVISLDIFLIFGVPLLLMLLGGGIYLVRRRG